MVLTIPHFECSQEVTYIYIYMYIYKSKCHYQIDVNVMS